MSDIVEKIQEIFCRMYRAHPDDVDEVKKAHTKAKNDQRLSDAWIILIVMELLFLFSICVGSWMGRAFGPR